MNLPNTISYNVVDMVFRSWLCTDRCFSEAVAGDLHISNCSQVMRVQPA
jgi:hypothetical protein